MPARSTITPFLQSLEVQISLINIRSNLTSLKAGILLLAAAAAGSCAGLPLPDPVQGNGQPTQVWAPTIVADEPDRWKPDPASSWQWQLSDPQIDRSGQVDIYDIDLFESDPRTIAELQAGGSRVLCYLNAGAWEDWRPDSGQFPQQVLGLPYQGWPGESWLDIRQLELLGPILEARLDLCLKKGFDGVEPDNIDGYQNDTGFDLTYQDQLAYNLWLADQAHQRGLSIGLKNDSDQAGDLAPYFDFALTEDCFAENWCQDLAPFLEAGKAVFAAEYTDRMGANRFQNRVCPQAAELGISAILKHRSLDSWRLDCPSQSGE
jgi:hypothetical protein